MDSTPPEVIAAIENANLVTDYFGSWPHFEDAEILSLQFDRGNHMKIIKTGAWPERMPESLTVKLYCGKHVSGDLSQKKSALITIRFHQFGRFKMDGFNYQNPIVELAIIWEYSENAKKNLFAVDWGGTAIRHDVSFTCERIEVLAVESVAENSPS